MSSSPDHVALIYGASRGIGAACAHAFSARGAHVCLSARNGTRLEAVSSSVSARGGTALAKVSDITDPKSLDDLIDTALGEFGRIDSVVNLAAVTGALDQPSWETSPEDWTASVATNLTGTFNLVRSVMPHMKSRNQGTLIFASSPFGDDVTPGMGAYGSTRAGSNALIRQLAAELDGTGVAACIAVPGITETEGLADFRAARGGQARFGDMTPTPAEVMANLFVLAALQPAGLINGLTLSWADAEVREAVLDMDGAEAYA